MVDDAPTPRAAAPVLEVVDVGVRFGGVVALDGVSLVCPAGTLTGLVGPNGAGKTTLIDTVSGLVSGSVTGRVVLDGAEVRGTVPHRLARAGLVRTFQGRELFEDLTVRENIDVAARPTGTVAHLRAAAWPIPTPSVADPVLDRVGLTEQAGTIAAELSAGRRALLALGRALAVPGRRVLVLDEPSSGLDGGERDELATVLCDLRAAGDTVLVVDHDVGLIMDVCDRVVVLIEGRVAAAGTPEEVRGAGGAVADYLAGGAR